MFWPCETRTSTCRSFATISSGLYRFLAIAVLLDVKDIPQVGPLQWGWINSSLRRHTADVRGRIPAPGSVGIAHTREQKEVSQSAARSAPWATFAVTIRHRGKEQTSEIPLPSPAIEVLALEAMSRDLDIAELIGQVLVTAINKDMIQKISRN